MNEAGLRLWAANEALSLGYGGVSEVSRATELSRTTIHAGIAELETAAVSHEPNRIRALHFPRAAEAVSAMTEEMH